MAASQSKNTHKFMSMKLKNEKKMGISRSILNSRKFLTSEFKYAKLKVTLRRALRERGAPTFWDGQRWLNRCSWPVRCAGKPEKNVRLYAAHFLMGCAVFAFVHSAKNLAERATEPRLTGIEYEL
jgi:hypothetical protein